MSSNAKKSAPLPRLTLVLGGARSGKSHYAESLIEASGLSPIYVATAESLDGEMSDRIARHQERRGKHWRTIEEPLALTETLLEINAARHAILVDCLTLWLTNLMVLERAVEDEVSELIDSLDQLDGTTVFVSNEVGQGIMPTNKMARHFIDHAGWLHRELAKKADQVFFVTAGIAQQLKP